MSKFEELADMHLKVCLNSNHQPFQWIYVVDDAWFHEEHVQGEKSVFEPSDCKTVEVTAIPWRASSTPASGDGAGFSGAGTSSGGGVEGQNDRVTAEKLMHFIKDKFTESCEYGICFCTFEYFWKHISEINEPQNAVFFDLRHQLASSNSTGLLTEWTRKIKSIGFVDDATAGNATLLGWILHFAFKFGMIPDAELCNVDPDHFLIISSAISPNSSSSQGDRDAIGQYLGMQQVIFDKLKNDSELRSYAKPSNFTFAPLPKNFAAGDTSFETGLEIFHNSFKEAGNWAAVQKAIYLDLVTIWGANKIDGLNCAGHVDSIDKKSYIIKTLRWAKWLHASPENSFKTDFQAVYFEYCEDGKLSLSGFLAILSRCAISPIAQAANQYSKNGTDLRSVRLPAKPGILFLFGLIEFVSLLMPDERGGRTVPKITLSEEGKEFCISISFNDSAVGTNGDLGISGLKKKYFGCESKSGNTATAVLRFLGKKRNEIHNLCIATAKGSLPIGDIVHCPKPELVQKLEDTLKDKRQGKQSGQNACDEYLCWLPEENPNALVVRLPLVIEDEKAPAL